MTLVITVPAAVLKPDVIRTHLNLSPQARIRIKSSRAGKRRHKGRRSRNGLPESWREAQRELSTTTVVSPRGDVIDEFVG
jgi:hypothetical protein